MKYNLSRIMTRAWELYRKLEISFSEALHRSWNSEKAKPENESRIKTAAAEAGITEPVNTWAGWKKEGYEVKHGEKSLFSVILIHASKGDGQTYKGSFFGLSQVAATA